MAKSDRRELIEVLRRRLVPAVEQLGFVVVAPDAREKSTEAGAAFPFGRLRRRTADGFDLIEIQFEKDGSAAFRLNVGQVPGVGIEHAVGHVAAEDVWVHYLEHFCTLYSSRFFRRWLRFEADDPAANGERLNELADSVIGLLPQVDDFLKSGKRGRNLRCV
jgi:hypothetical protein